MTLKNNFNAVILDNLRDILPQKKIVLIIYIYLYIYVSSNYNLIDISDHVYRF